ncbi:MAG: hypothetical protein ACRC0V_05090 [Fusobacteriaceae bacterium]
MELDFLDKFILVDKNEKEIFLQISKEMRKLKKEIKLNNENSKSTSLDLVLSFYNLFASLGGNEGDIKIWSLKKEVEKSAKELMSNQKSGVIKNFHWR